MGFGEGAAIEEQLDVLTAPIIEDRARPGEAPIGIIVPEHRIHHDRLERSTVQNIETDQGAGRFVHVNKQPSIFVRPVVIRNEALSSQSCSKASLERVVGVAGRELRQLERTRTRFEFETDHVPFLLEPDALAKRSWRVSRPRSSRARAIHGTWAQGLLELPDVFELETTTRKGALENVRREILEPVLEHLLEIVLEIVLEFHGRRLEEPLTPAVVVRHPGCTSAYFHEQAGITQRPSRYPLHDATNPNPSIPSLEPAAHCA